MNYYIEVLKKYAVFKGRSRRAEFWYFTLFNFIIGLIFSFISSIIGKNNLIISNTFAIIYLIYALAIFIPGLAVLIRRLHDTGKSGWMIFINLIPLIGSIWLLVLLLSDSNSGDNKYGPNPKITPSPVSIS